MLLLYIVKSCFHCFDHLWPKCTLCYTNCCLMQLLVVRTRAETQHLTKAKAQLAAFFSPLLSVGERWGIWQRGEALQGSGESCEAAGQECSMLPAAHSGSYILPFPTRKCEGFNSLKYSVKLSDMLQEIVSVAVQNVQYMENIIKEPNKNGTIGSSHSNGNDPYKHFVSITLFFVNRLKMLVDLFRA